MVWDLDFVNDCVYNVFVIVLVIWFEFR